MENKKCQTLVSKLITKYLAFFICDPVGTIILKYYRFRKMLDMWRLR